MPSIRTRPASSVARLCLSLLVLSCALAALPSPASAGAPATVTVRVEGFNGHTLLPQTTVTTNATPINVDGNAADDCSGTSAGGALYDAVQGNWGVIHDSFGVLINAIDGVDYGTSSDAYWGFWYDSAFASMGACAQELGPGDHVVFVATCYATGPDCTDPEAPRHFLTESAPSAATLQAGSSVTVTVGSIATAYPGGPESLPPGVTVTAGPVSATPNAAGVTTLSLPTVGTYVVQASAPGSVPSDSYTVCVHNGNDGNCGTPLPPQPTAPTTNTATVSTTTSTTATATAGVQGRLEHAPRSPSPRSRPTSSNSHTYPAGRGPRTLAGHVTAPGPLTKVQPAPHPQRRRPLLLLRRRHRALPRVALRRRARARSSTSARRRRSATCSRAASARGATCSTSRRSTPPDRCPRSTTGRAGWSSMSSESGHVRLSAVASLAALVVALAAAGAGASPPARSGAGGPYVTTMIVGPRGTLFGPATVDASATAVAVAGRRCAVAAGTPLAALSAAYGAGGPSFALRDYGACSGNAADSGQLFVSAVGAFANRGANGWEYKVDERCGHDRRRGPERRLRQRTAAAGRRSRPVVLVRDDGERRLRAHARHRRAGPRRARRARHGHDQRRRQRGSGRAGARRHRDARGRAGRHERARAGRAPRAARGPGATRSRRRVPPSCRRSGRRSRSRDSRGPHRGRARAVRA